MTRGRRLGNEYRAGYRVYKEHDLYTLQFVRRSRQLGFSIPEIATLPALWRDRQRSSADVKQVNLRHIKELHTKISELQSMVDTLEHLASHYDGPQCPILTDLQGDDL